NRIATNSRKSTGTARRRNNGSENMDSRFRGNDEGEGSGDDEGEAQTTRTHPHLSSVAPVGYEDVGFVRVLHQPVGRPDQLLAVWTEHGEAVEGGVGGNLLQSGSVRVDEKNVEVAELGIGVVVGREDDLFAVGGPRWAKAGAAQVGDLALVGSVS